MGYKYISSATLQYAASSTALASGNYLKAYEAGTSTPLSMGTDTVPTSTLAKVRLNSLGLPISNESDENSWFNPTVNENYRLVWYANATDADNDALASAVWDVDNLSLLFDASEVPYTDNVTVAQFLDNLFVDDYVALRALTSSQLVDGQSVRVTDSGIAGAGTIVKSTSHGLTDNGGTIIVIDANTYWRRDFDGPVQMAWFSLVSDWDGATGTDNTTAAQAAVDYAFSAGIHEVDCPDGEFFITKIQIPSATNYSTAGMTLKGLGIRATSFYSDTSRPIEILPSDGEGGSATSYNVHLVGFSVRSGLTGATNGIFCNKLAWSTFHNINVSGFNRSFYLLSDSFLNRFTKLYMSGTHEYGFRMDASGTTNYWDQCFDFGASERAYKLTGDYSSIGSIAADECTGDYPYEFSFFSGDIGSLGSESCDCLRMITTANSSIEIGYIRAFNNSFDVGTSKGGILRGTGSTVNVGQIRVETASSFATAITGVTQAASNPVVTSVSHGRSTGDTIYFTGIVGMTELNFQFDIITVTGTDTFTLDNIDTSAYTAYTSGGTATYSSTQAPIDMFESNVSCKSIELENCHFSGEPAGSSSESFSLAYTSGGTPIAVGTEGTGRPYIGFDRGRMAFPDPDRRVEGTRAVPKAIFLDMDGSLRYDSDGNDYNAGRPARVGDLFLDSDPADNHQLGRIVTVTGSTLSACASERIPLELSGTTANRPTTNLRAGLYYFDTTLGQPIWYDGSGWVDATGTTA
jgi:hypothetical protein